MRETISIIDIEHRDDGRYWLVAEQWDVMRNVVLRRKDLTASYVTYRDAARARASAYEMWSFYEEWRMSERAQD
jgi:hypothetical protein